MRRLAFGLFAILCIAAAAFAASTMGPWAPIQEPAGVDTVGGPDAWGYTWIDSQQGGGPAYTWKDITTIGTQVTGLGDDNYVGPFPVGFTFQYYWYPITQYWIGSNGYLKFGSGALIASPFPASIPLPAAPNDFVGVYIADWFVTGPGLVYRWNNADSLVVSWINVPAWSSTPPGYSGSHTFQVIMSRLDSSFTFEYGTQTGTTYDADKLVGIENSSGLVGLQRAADMYMPSNYAIYWNSPSSSSYVAHDMAASASMNANSEGFFVLNGAAVTPTVKVKNVGTVSEATFTVQCLIQQTGGATVYNQTVTAGPLAAGAELEVTFTPNWTPVTNAQYVCTATVTLAGDMNPANNQRRTESHVMTLPGTMLYDGNPATIFLLGWVGGGGGAANRFVPPSYPVRIDSISIYTSTTGSYADPYTAQILDDNGPGGQPGTVLFTQSVTSPASGWSALYVGGQNIQITSGAFFVAWIQQTATTARLGYDTTVVFSRQTWEYTGVWANYREMETNDFMIRARVNSLSVNPNVTVALIPYGTPIIIPLQGGSFSYNIAAHNGEATSQTFQAWGMLTLPNGNPYGPVLGPATVTLAPGATINRDRTQNIPGNAPSGNYLYNAHVGTYPTPIWNSASFPFTKSATGDGGAWVSEYANYGEPFDSEVPAVLPETFSLNGNHPNPFNPTTTISFALPEASQVTLTVYDVQGQVVAQLVNGWRDAGSHSAAFDGTNLASGIYLYHLTAGSFDATGKMVLMK